MTWFGIVQQQRFPDGPGGEVGMEERCRQEATVGRPSVTSKNPRKKRVGESGPRQAEGRRVGRREVESKKSVVQETKKMKMFFTRRNYVRAAAYCGVAVLAVVLMGCQTPGKLVSSKECAVCPMCKTETRTAPIKGLTYTKQVCPLCHTVRNFNTSDEAADLTEVQVCDHCKCVVKVCPACASKR